MSTLVTWPVFIDYFASFAPWFDAVIKDDSCQLTVGNGSSVCLSMRTLYSVGQEMCL